jgi:tRNA(Ile)-lysidine synthetase-like protein
MSKRKTVIYSLNNINTNINTGNIIKTKQSILIAVSGGQDSICLLFIFIQLKKQWHWSFGIIYCNHLWQKSSFFSGSLVLKIAYMLTVPIYYVTTTDKIFSEQESRKWRYAIFFRISCFYNYTIISSGHTESDKTETVLFQFIRGGSLKSLVPLKTVKHFASNSKFVKKRYITNTFIYFKKNLTFLKKKQSRPRAGPRFLIRQSLYNRNLIKNEITYYSNKSLFFTAKKNFF